MGLSKEDYYRSALERLEQARQIYDDGHLAHALAVYIAGLSVECMLRAFIMRRTSELNEGPPVHHKAKLPVPMAGTGR